MRSWTLLTAGVGAAVIALAGCSTSINGVASPVGAAQGGVAQIASVADLGAVVRHNANQKDSVHFESSINVPDSGALTATGDMKFGNGQGAAQMTMDMPGIGSMQIIMVNAAMYAKLPASVAGEMGNANKPWTKLNLSGAAGAALGSTVNLADEMNPTKMIDQIKSAGTITQVSHEQINGLPTTHYSINVNVAKLAQSMTDNPTEKQALSTVNIPTIPFDLWVDAANLPIRIVTNMFYSGALTTKPEQMTTTTNYSNWGEEVTITAPPANQVGTMSGN